MAKSTVVQKIFMRCLECQYGLLPLLYADDVLSHEQFSQLSHLSAHEMNGSMVRLLGRLDARRRERFLKALEGKKQRHVAAFVKSGGGTCVYSIVT